MESHDAARAVFTRIQSVDPENASKIAGYILFHDPDENEMKHLAFGPDNLLHSVIAKAKTKLGLSSNTSPASNFSTSTAPFSPISPSSPSIWSVSGSSNANAPISHPNRSKSVDFYGQSMSPRWENGGSHRRGSSVNEICFETGDFSPGLSKGVFNNGSTCNFVHGGGEIRTAIVDSPSKFDAFELYQQEALLRSKVAQQQRLAAAQYLAGVNSPYNKFNLIQREAQRSAAVAALMMEEKLNKLNRFGIGRNDLSEMGYGESCGHSAPGSRQIYLTFPADSTFKEEDVSNYFSIFGPVQDVRIPFQHKRMFGFVTFLYPETVRIILAKGNPHFVCDSRVLVKPYKEKGRLPDKKQQLDRYEFLSCSSPSGMDREPFEMHVGPRMFNSNHPEMLRKKLEQELRLEQALEFQRRRLMDLQLLDMKNHHSYQHDASAESPPHSASSHETSMNLSIPPTSINAFLDDASEQSERNPTASPTKEPQEEVGTSSDNANGNEEGESEIKMSNFPESLSASPTESAAEHQSIFAPKAVDAVNDVAISTSAANSDLLIPLASALNIAPPKSCSLEIPRVSSEHEAIGM